MLEAKALLIVAAALIQGGDLGDDARELPSARNGAIGAAGLLAAGALFFVGDSGEQLEGAPCYQGRRT